MSFVSGPGATARSCNDFNNVATCGAAAPENVEVRVTTLTQSANNVLVRVWNYQTETVGDIQAINTIAFRFAGVSQPSGTLTGRSGTAINIADTTGKNWTVLGAFTTGWQAQSSSFLTDGLQVTALTGGSPTRTIIGTPDANNHYGANGSIRNHNPFLQTNAVDNLGQYVEFTLTVPGVDSETIVSAVSAVFGTGAGTSGSAGTNIVTLQQPGSAVPEPSGVSMAAAGLTLIALGSNRRGNLKNWLRR